MARRKLGQLFNSSTLSRETYPINIKKYNVLSLGIRKMVQLHHFSSRTIERQNKKLKISKTIQVRVAISAILLL